MRKPEPIDMSHTMMLLPPRPEVCQMCSTDHDAAFPHNAHSLYYQMRFQLEHGRHPDWRDAMEYCTEPMRQAWTEKLGELGIDVAAGQSSLSLTRRTTVDRPCCPGWIPRAPPATAAVECVHSADFFCSVD